MYANQWHAMRGFSRDPSVTKQRLKPGTVRRIAGYARPYRWDLLIFLLAAALDAVVTVSYPLLLGVIIDKGILPKRTDVVLALAGVVVGLALFDAFLSLVQRWFTARVGEGLIYDLRTAGVRARAAAADRVLHPGADRLAGQPAEQRRDRRPAGADLDAVVGGRPACCS